MPRFFFDIDDGETQFRDNEGVVLPDPRTARDEAMGVLPDIAREATPDEDERTWLALVRDESGRTILRATLLLKAEWVIVVH